MAPTTAAGVREMEYESISTGIFETTSENDVISQPGVFRLKPDMRNKKRWKTDTHFHDNLCLPAITAVSSSGSSREPNTSNDLLLTLEARASEGLAIALSAAKDARFKEGTTTEILLGGSGNTMTRIQDESNSLSVPGRVCRDDLWVSYWVAVISGGGGGGADDESNSAVGVRKLFVGVGDSPGEQCIAILHILGDGRNKNDANDNDAVKTATSEVVVNEAKETVDGKAAANPLPPLRYVGLRNAGTADRQPPKPLFVRKIKLSAVVPESVKQKIASLPEDAGALDMIVLGEGDPNLSTTDRETVELLCKYRDQCTKARVRATKFGVPYQPPGLAAALPWSQARRLRANPASTTGFATGMDLQSEAERDKQEKRRQRFGVPTTHGGDEVNDDEGDKIGDDTGMEVTDEDALPVDQAWDKEELIRKLRVDPPPSLWENPPATAAAEEKDEFRMETEEPVLTPEKIHLCSIDWAAFKQIRTNDIMKHFSIYGPSYVEWLGDLSCNVLFEDKFSAARYVRMSWVEANSKLCTRSSPPCFYSILYSLFIVALQSFGKHVARAPESTASSIASARGKPRRTGKRRGYHGTSRLGSDGLAPRQESFAQSRR